MPSSLYAMVATLLRHQRCRNQPPVQKGVLVIRLPPGTTMEGIPLVVGGSKAEFIDGLRRLRGKPG
jgi:hypothetical protein